jgi:superfamily II DNA or RNA helicase
MTLSARLARQFSSGVRARGEDCFFRRVVHIDHGSAAELDGYARGSRRYDISLSWEEPFLFVSCDCPYFESEGRCKHLWAAVLEAEKHTYLSDVARAREVILQDADPDLEEDEEDIEIDDDEDSFVLTPPRAAAPPEPPAWRKHLATVTSFASQAAEPREKWAAKKQIVYQIDVRASIAANGLVLVLGSRDIKADGSYSRVVDLRIKHSQIQVLPAAEDRAILSMLAGGAEYFGYGDPYGYRQLPATNLLANSLAAVVIPKAIETGRCVLRVAAEAGPLKDPKPLVWDNGGAWQFEMELSRKTDGAWIVTGVLQRGEDRMELTVPALIDAGLLFAGDRVAPLAESTAWQWLWHLRRQGPIEAPSADAEALLKELLEAPGVPAIRVPEELGYQEVEVQPRPLLRVRGADARAIGDEKLRAALSFDYEGKIVPALAPGRGSYEPETRRFLARSVQAEDAACTLLAELGLRFLKPGYSQPEPTWDVPAKRLPKIVRVLLEAGWHVEAEGKVFRRPGGFKLDVSTGFDWFELRGEFDFGGSAAQLPELLEALRRGDNLVRLDDGTYGMLPEEWLQRIGMFAGLGERENGHVRFRKNQAVLLDALLAAQPHASCDEVFARMRQELRSFEGVRRSEQPEGFVGELRQYQCEGLGWMEFLRRFSFGGCLADDMGVGKTAQVLALLETRRQLRESGENAGPSLVVVPRSLIFNWKEEAARFTPKLRVLDYSGSERNGDDFTAYDMVLSTYGTLRRDALRLKDIEFDYIVLDEAQAVKNAATESAKAVRLLRGSHRLALSGTPVENHLGELFSLFEFLNPGMLGTAGIFKLGGAGMRNPDEDTRRLLGQALRPFILRRTKEQVAHELPPKTEQTIHCEMEPGQRKLYNELRQHYRDALLKRIQTEGLAKSKIQVLEALLRLRQAACHPGLIDQKRSEESSAKLDVLLAQLREVLAEGHKALVFSQFTSLLKILRDRLSREGITYEYLDGRTRHRQACVERFQNDEKCLLFLISLKAGGLGLNLTAAEYVFLLDPWWNPAVEAQAMDRAHRIGQTRQVFAYRLIARDTVEEKVLELQKTKRDLAAAIIGADNSLIRNLRSEDLELLLS